MPSPSIIDRFRGTRFKSGELPPSFFLEDPARAHYVDRGHLDIFAVERIDHEVVGRRQFVARITPGGVAFGFLPLPDPQTPERSFSFLAAPSVDAVLIEGSRDGIAADALDLAAVDWIDEWVFQLSEFLVRRQAPPRNALLLEAEPEMSFPAGACLSSHHATIIWITASGPARLAGRGDLVIEAGEPLFPISERSWLELETPAEVSALLTPTALLNKGFWLAFDRFAARILEFAALRLVEHEQAADARHLSAHQARRTTVTRALGSLGGILGTAADGTLPDSAPGQSSLYAATRLVATAVGTPLAPSAKIPDTTDPKRAVAAIARTSGIRTRTVSLKPEWWRKDGPSVVGFTTGDNRPLALLADGRGRYRVVDPDSGRTQTVGAREAETIASTAVMLYPPLPDSATGKALIRFALHGRGRDIGLVVAMIVLSGPISLLVPILTGKLLADIIPRADIAMWGAALGALLIGALSGTVFRFVLAISLLRIESRIDERLQAAVWNRLVSLPVSFFRRFTAGDLASRANAVSSLHQLLTGAVTASVIGGILSLYSFGLLFYYSWSLALAAGGMLLILAVAGLIFANRQMRHHRAALRIEGALDGLVFQIINGLAKLRVANAGSFALAWWGERYSEQMRETLAARRWGVGQIAFVSLFQPLSVLALFAIIYYAFARGGSQSSFGLADFLSFNAAFGQLIGTMTGLMGAMLAVAAAIPLFERVRPILDTKPETPTGVIDPGELIGSIEFANVSFRYLPEGPDAVDSMSFRIRPGDYVAFVGPSGSGKSTVYRLLLGFEQQNSGAILLDGHDLSSLDMPAVRSRMGVVLQNGQLVAGSILENILGASGLTTEDAWRAAQAAGIEEDIRAMPMELHTVLAEGGAGLSGGQRQRLLIARALARKPRIMLLDEATSALDNRTQKIVQESLNNLNITRVVIAHRLSTIRDVDRIFVLEGGRLVESGRYNDLVERDGAFASLLRRQLV